MQRELEYEGATLKMEPRAAYVQRKQDERHARPNSPHNQMDVGALMIERLASGTQALRHRLTA